MSYINQSVGKSWFLVALILIDSFINTDITIDSYW